MNYRFDNNQYFITLAPGDEINSSFETIAKNKGIQSAWISGIGAITEMQMGYYDIETKNYIRKIFNDDYELTNLSGNISIKDNEVYSHTHINFSDRKFNVFGGHLFHWKISAAGEFMMTVGGKSINRVLDNKIGLALWCMNK